MVKFINCIICEDVRKEEGGKRTAIGIFSGDILAEKLPGLLNLSFYAEYIGGVEGDMLKFFIEIGDDVVEANMTVDGISSTNINGSGNVTLAKMLVEVEASTEIKLSVSINGGRKRRLCQRSVLLKEG